MSAVEHQQQQPLWQRLARKTLSAVAVGVLALTLALGPVAAGPAEAARSGGRVGGSSFSSARSSAGSYSSGRAYSGAGAGYSGGGGYSTGRTGISTYSAPTLSFGPSFFYPSPFSGFGYGYGAPVVVQRTGGDGGFGGVLLFLLAAGALVWFLQNNVVGNGLGGGAERVGVAKVQVGLLGSARSLQRDLERIAKRADTNTSDGLAYVLQETVLALLRNPEYSIYGAAKVDNEGNLDAGEDRFNQISMAERRKFEEETLVNVSGRTKNRGSTGRWTAQPGQNELIVVTILVAAQGGLKLPPIRSQEELQTALTRLGALRPDQVLAVEVLWTPQDDGDYFTREDLATDYPYLNTL